MLGVRRVPEDALAEVAKARRPGSLPHARRESRSPSHATGRRSTPS